jgi:hypothetical protein
VNLHVYVLAPTKVLTAKAERANGEAKTGTTSRPSPGQAVLVFHSQIPMGRGPQQLEDCTTLGGYFSSVRRIARNAVSKKSV